MHKPISFRHAYRDASCLRGSKHEDTTRVITDKPLVKAANGNWTWPRKDSGPTEACRVSQRQLVRLLDHDLERGGHCLVRPVLAVKWSVFFDGPARADTLRAIVLRSRPQGPKGGA